MEGRLIVLARVTVLVTGAQGFMRAIRIIVPPYRSLRTLPGAFPEPRDSIAIARSATCFNTPTQILRQSNLPSL